MSDERLTLEELKEAMRGKRAIVVHFVEIRDRVFDLLKRLREERQCGERVSGGAETTNAVERLATDAAALVGYLQLMLDENERLVAYLIGLEEAGTISRTELEFLMGLGRTRRRARTPSMSTTRSEDENENERFIDLAERWLDEQFEWAMREKRLAPKDGPWRRGAGTAEERLMDALHHLQHALILYDDCSDDRCELRAAVEHLSLPRDVQ